MPLGNWTDQQVLNQLDSGAKWLSPTITYSFATSTAGIFAGGGEGAGFSELSAGGKAAATLALTLWDDLIAFSIQKIDPGATSYSSDIEFGMTNTGIGYAHAYYPTTGSVWFSSAYGSGSYGNNLVAPTVGNHGFVSYIHEIGHALGLDHMGNYDVSDTPSSYQDSTVYSVMSYFGPSWGSGAANGEGLVAWADWIGADGTRYSPQTPMLNDVMAIQSKYGVDTTTRTGDTVYGFNCNVTGTLESIYNFTINKNPILTIFDAAGNDTLDLSGWTTSSTIDIARGGFSSCNSMTLNIAIAYTCDIENAIGGSGDDTISGNALGNLLKGGAGLDTLYGLAGNDKFNGGTGNDTISGGDGIDYVYFDLAWGAMSYSYNAVTMTVTVSGDGIGVDTVTGAEYFVDVDNVVHSFSDLTGVTPPADPIYAAIAAVSAPSEEGNSGAHGYLFKVTLSAPAADAVAINWSVNGGAADGADFVGPTSGVVSFAAGQTEAMIELQISGDTTAEANEAFTVVLSSPGAGITLATASATGQILNDDIAPMIGSDLANTLTGTAGNDVIYGRGGGDTINGYEGDDYIDGGVGSDKMAGGGGNDTYVVDSRYDRVTETSGAGTDTIVTSLTTFAMGNYVEGLVFGGGAGVSFKGTGNSAANDISGGSGGDVLNGGLGGDILRGLAGADSFMFTTTLGGGNVDTIADFNVADDTIRLENSIFRAFGSTTGVLKASAFAVGAAASDADDRIIFNADTGALLYDKDGTGVTAAVQFATISLSGLTGTLSNADFFIV